MKTEPRTVCLMPRTTSVLEARLYKRLLTAHCPNGHNSKKCQGTLSITGKHITASCKLCGDSRGMYPNATATSEAATDAVPVEAGVTTRIGTEENT